MRNSWHIWVVFGSLISICLGIAIYVELNPRSTKPEAIFEECLILTKKSLIAQEGFPDASSFHNKVEFSFKGMKCAYSASNQEWLKFEEGQAFWVKGKITAAGICELNSVISRCKGAK